METLEQQEELLGHTDRVWSVQWSPLGTIVGCAADGIDTRNVLKQMVCSLL